MKYKFLKHKSLLASLTLVWLCRTSSAATAPVSLVEPSPGDWLAHAAWLEKHHDWPGLLGWSQGWLRLHPNHAPAWFVLGRALSELQRTEEAVAAYQQDLRLDPDDHYGHHNLGNLYRKQRFFDKAMHAYREALRVKPDYIPAWQNLGIAYYEQRGVDGVATALRQLHASEPELAEAWRKLAVGYSLTRDEKLAAEAIQVLKGLDAQKRERMFSILFAGL